jgi:hypothetical protein
MTDEEKRRARVIKKIRALRNKTVAAGCTEDEAKSSAELARKLMDKYKVTEEELRAAVEKKYTKKQRPRSHADPTDFWAYLPERKYWFVKTRKLWPAETIRSIFGKGAPEEFDATKPTHSATWCPGKPTIILDTIADEGGLIPTPGCKTFNMYRPPMPIDGNPDKITPWMKHGEKLWGGHWDHIVKWFACRVQHPEIKINHGLVMGSLYQGIGKDLVTAPVRRAVGEWNFKDVSATRAFKYADDQNSFLERVILRLNEAHDLGDARFAFYEKSKPWMAAPPETLNIVDKWIKQHSMMNLVGVIITTNHRTDGLYMDPQDRRHYCAWSDALPEQFPDEYWTDFANWLETEGRENVAHYLATLKLDDFDPKARPPKTDFWWAMVHANQHSETAGLLDVLDTVAQFDRLGETIYPAAITIDMLAAWARAGGHKLEEIETFLRDNGKRRQLSHRLEKLGYEAHQNTAYEGMWKVDGKRQIIYVQRALTPAERDTACQMVVATNGTMPIFPDFDHDGNSFHTAPGPQPEDHADCEPWELEDEDA